MTESVVEARFRTAVASPLRAALVRLLHGRRQHPFEVESLMGVFGRLRLDIENCLNQLVDTGLLTVVGPPVRYVAREPEDEVLARLLRTFLEQDDRRNPEDDAPSVAAFRDMIGRDEKMLVVFEWIRTAAKSDISVLVLGPTGSGKELVARMIHELGRRGKEQFQAVNCAALPDSLFESEMFGYEKGAFTGAQHRKVGRIEGANGGTLFLDEIGDLSLQGQAKLLRALEERRIERLGGGTSVRVDFRLISATNRPLEAFVSDGRFREDLYYRTNAFSIRLPSLRERPVDIPILAARFLDSYCSRHQLPIGGKTFSPEAIALLRAYQWPGNIRELESTVFRAALSAPDEMIQPEHVAFLHAASEPSARRDGFASLRDAERAHIVRVLEFAKWNKKEAAAILAVSRGTLYRKMTAYGMEPTVRN